MSGNTTNESIVDDAVVIFDDDDEEDRSKGCGSTERDNGSRERYRRASALDRALNSNSCPAMGGLSCDEDDVIDPSLMLCT